MITWPMVAAVIIRPHLWTTAAATVFELAPKQWWRRWPFLPLPDPDWLQFRTVTAYGGDGTLPLRPKELVAWLEWKRST